MRLRATKLASISFGVTGDGVPANAILYNGVPMLYNGKYILFTKS